MIAEEYGYRVLPGRALETPGIEAVLRGRERAPLRWALPAFAVAAAAIAAGLLIGGPGIALTASGAVVAAVTALLWRLWSRARRKERRVLSGYGWQVWPCAEGSTEVVSGTGERRDGRRWARESRVVLLEPGGQSHCSFPPPWDGWDGPAATGRLEGEVWFAGDPRFGGVLAVPGGMPFRYVTRAKPGRRQGSPAEDEAARRAGLMP